jgi:hypothetical protein
MDSRLRGNDRERAAMTRAKRPGNDGQMGSDDREDAVSGLSMRQGEKKRNNPLSPPLYKGGNKGVHPSTGPSASSGQAQDEEGTNRRTGMAGIEHYLNTKRGRNIPENQEVTKFLKEML